MRDARLLLILSIYSLSSPLLADGAFVPQTGRLPAVRVVGISRGMSAIVPEADVNRAHECADNFGKCPTEEMEELKNELHNERITSFVDKAAGVPSLLEPEEELDHFYLEQDLELQLKLLKEKDRPKDGGQDSPAATGFPSDTMFDPEKEGAKGGVSSMAMTSEPSLQSFSQNGMDMFMLGGGVFETLAIVMAILIVFKMPHLLHV